MVVYRAAAAPLEIAASPARVREIFLDFPKWPQWHTTHFQSITPPAGKTGPSLQKGDTVRVSMPGMSFNPTIVENSPERFVWDGGFKPILNGRHFFEFQPSKVTPGHTTFVNAEDFTGWLFAWNWVDRVREAGPGFERVNRDLKRRCEGVGEDL